MAEVSLPHILKTGESEKEMPGGTLRVRVIDI